MAAIIPHNVDAKKDLHKHVKLVYNKFTTIMIYMDVANDKIYADATIWFREIGTNAIENCEYYT